MIIKCHDWQEGLAYFLDPSVIAKMKRLGLEIVRMDHKNKEVHLSCQDDESILASISAIATNESPELGVAVSTITSEATF